MAGLKTASIALLPSLAIFHRYPSIAQSIRTASILLASRPRSSIPSKTPTATRPRAPKMASQDLIPKVTSYVRTYMANYDPSHDYDHIHRVVRLAQQLHAAEPASPPRDPAVVHLAALLHDVGDKKYLRDGEDGATMVRDVLLGFGAAGELAEKVQAICLGVSYSSEVADPGRVKALVERYPELAVVQDADRLDAIGAVGIGRCFAFGGAKDRPMEETMRHFDDKLIRIEGLMKTGTGRGMARERCERLRVFKSWWEGETAVLEDS